MNCFVCEVEIKPYQPGTLLDSEMGAAHENCFKEYREDYRTADEIIKENQDDLENDDTYGYDYLKDTGQL